MKQSARRSVFLVLAGSFLALALPAQEVPQVMDPFSTIEKRSLGSQIFQLDLGVLFPLFTYTTVDPVTVIQDTNINVGGAGHIRWSAFFNDTMAIGFDLGGNVSTGPNGKIFANMLLGPRLSAVFRAGMFQFPVSITPGLSLLSYDSATYVGFGLRPEIGAYIDLDKDWALGLNVGYNWTPEVYLDPASAIPDSEERVGNSLEITLSIMYSF